MLDVEGGMWDVKCGMWKVRMWNVKCWIWDLEWGMRHGNVLPQITQIFTDAVRAAFIKKTRDPAKPLRPTEGNCTDAHGWVFSRILYSCSAAHCLVLMRSRRNGSTQISTDAIRVAFIKNTNI